MQMPLFMIHENDADLSWEINLFDVSKMFYKSPMKGKEHGETKLFNQCVIRSFSNIKTFSSFKALISSNTNIFKTNAYQSTVKVIICSTDRNNF